MKIQIYRSLAGRTAIFFLLALTLLVSTGLSGQVFVGEPLGEALFDLSRDAVLIGDTLSGGSPLRRTDVFKLRDGRLLAVTSVAERKGEPFSIIDLKVASLTGVPLKADTPSATRVELPER